MRVWRICKAEQVATAFTGEGAILYPGRWHHPGTPVVYCSESRALAALEQLVHLHRNQLPPNFACFELEIADDLAISEVRPEDLPAEWRRQPGPRELRDIGTRWAEAGETIVLQVPSAIVPGEHNFLLNPRHPDFGRLAIGDPEPFAFDERLVGSGPSGGRATPRPRAASGDRSPPGRATAGSRQSSESASAQIRRPLLPEDPRSALGFLPLAVLAPSSCAAILPTLTANTVW